MEYIRNSEEERWLHNRVARRVMRSYLGDIRKADGNNTRTVEGLAIVFGKRSQPIGNKGMIEIIDATAVNEELIKNSDIFCYLNHDENRGVLARSRYGEGSLTLQIMEEGLYYRFEAPPTQLGDELLNYLNRGEIYTSSFSFYCPEDGEKWTREADGQVVRHITKISRLTDVSPVFEPAYLDTDCRIADRKMGEIEATDKKLKIIQSEIDFL